LLGVNVAVAVGVLLGVNVAVAVAVAVGVAVAVNVTVGVGVFEPPLVKVKLNTSVASSEPEPLPPLYRRIINW
jgi:hypothetical protein